MGKDKACNDIINTAKNNINFSYCHTKYFYSYNIKYNIKSFTKYGSYNILDNQPGYGTLEIGKNIILENDKTYKVLDCNSTYSEPIVNDKEQKQFEDDLIEFISKDNLETVLQNSIDEYTKFISYLKKMKQYYSIDIEFFETLLAKAKEKVKDINLNQTKVMEDYENMNKNLFISIVLKKIVSMLVDGFSLSLRPSSILRKLMFLPYIGILIFILEIASLIYDIFKNYQGNKFAKEFGLIHSFYSYLTYEVASILLNNTNNSEVFHKYRYNNRYILRMYNSNMVDNEQMYMLLKAHIHPKNIYIEVDIDEEAYNQSMISEYNTQNESDIKFDKTVQISTFYSPRGVNSSSYFFHIHKMIYESNKFLFIQTSNFSSPFISSIMKSSYENLYNNKYSVILSNSQCVNNVTSKSQRYAFDIIEQNIGSSSLALLPVRHIKLDEFFITVKIKLEEYVTNIFNTYTIISNRKYDVNVNKDDIKKYADNMYDLYLFRHLLQYYTAVAFDISQPELNQVLIYKAVSFFNIYDKRHTCIKYLYGILNHYDESLYSLSIYSDYNILSKILDRKKECKDIDLNISKDICSFWNSIADLHSFINNLKIIVSSYYFSNIDENLKEDIKAAVAQEHELLDEFFNKSKDEDLSLSSYIMSSSILKDLFKQIISTEYAIDFLKEQKILYKKFSVLVQNVDTLYEPLSLYLLYIYESKYKIKLSELEKNGIPCNTIDFTIFRDIVLELIYHDIETKLPVTLARLEYVFGSRKYFHRMCEYIFMEYIYQYGENSLFVFTSFISSHISVCLHKKSNELRALINDDKSFNPLFNLEDMKIEYYLNMCKEQSPFILDSIFKYLTLLISSILTGVKSEHSESVESLVIDKTVDIVNSVVVAYIKEKMPAYIDIDDFSSIDQFAESINGLDFSNPNAINSVIKSFNKLSIRINVELESVKRFKSLHTMTTAFIACTNIYKDKQLFNNVLSSNGTVRIGFDTIIHYSEKYTANAYNNSNNIYINNNLHNTMSVHKAFSDFHFKDNFKKLINLCCNITDNDFNEMRDKLIEENKKKYIKQFQTLLKKNHNISFSERAFEIIKIKNGTYELKLQDNYNIVNKSINNAVNKSLKEYNAAGLKLTNSNINIRPRLLLKNGAQPVYQSIIKNQSFKKVIKNTGKFLFSKEDFISAVAGLAIDYFFPTADYEEYKAKRNAIKYAYLHRRADIPGAYWNQEKGYFTIPVQINQNFIMSDFRAMVVGGAHFDNSCFIKGTSSGIFVQDNKKVSKSFIEIMIDYIDNISVTDVDKKMGRYLLAYCNIINYLYQLSMVHNDCSTELNKLYDTASSILSTVGMSLGTGVIHQVKEKPNGTKEPINNNYYVQTDNFLMKDFVIQLKRFGESNYKFYHTQEETQNGKQSKKTNKKGKGSLTFLDDDNKEIPLLLGSLIYDEQWFKSTIDSEN